MKLVDVSLDSNRRVLIKIAKALGLLALVIVLTGAVLTLIGGRRYEAELRKLKATGEPYTLADLAGPPVPAAENGAVIYEKIFERFLGHSTFDTDAPVNKERETESKELSDVYDKLTADAPMTDADWTEARTVAARYDWVLPLVDEAAARPMCKFPVKWQDGIAASLAHLAQLRQLERVIVTKAIVYAHDGQLDNALRCVNLALRATSAVETEPTIIAMLVRISQIDIACRGLQMVAREAALNPEQAMAIYDVLASIDLNPHAVLGVKGERGFGLLLFAQLRREGMTKNMLLLTSPDGEEPAGAWIRDAPWRIVSYFDGAAYLRFMNKRVDTATVPYRKLDMDRENYEVHAVPKYCVFTRLLAPVFRTARAASDKGIAHLAMAQGAMALAAYKARFGGYPGTLAEASDRLGWRIPEDPFSGKSLIYKRQGRGYLLYSIGVNLKDDGGTPRPKDKSDRHAGDLVWRLDK